MDNVACSPSVAISANISSRLCRRRHRGVCMSHEMVPRVATNIDTRTLYSRGIWIWEWSNRIRYVKSQSSCSRCIQVFHSVFSVELNRHDSYSDCYRLVHVPIISYPRRSEFSCISDQISRPRFPLIHFLRSAAKP